jgi:uncharacterized protein YaeQ
LTPIAATIECGRRRQTVCAPEQQSTAVSTVDPQQARRTRRSSVRTECILGQLGWYFVLKRLTMHGMALSATMRRFMITLADADRSVYETLDWRVAQHPSESPRYLIARVLARALEHGDGLEFSKGGVSDDEEPALVQRDLRGDLVAWIEVGAPTADRLHKASKASPRVVVYTWKLAQVREGLAERRIHRADALELIELDPEWLDRVAETLDRTNAWDLSVSGGAIYLTVGDRLFESQVSGSASRSG